MLTYMNANYIFRNNANVSPRDGLRLNLGFPLESMMFKSWEGWMKFRSDVRLPPPVQLKVHWASSLTPSPPTKKI